MVIADLLEIRPVLQQLVNQKMPAKLAYALAKNIKQVNAELETFEQTRIKLLADNWPLNEKTQQYDVPEEEKAKWNKMYDELIKAEVKLDPYLVEPDGFDGVELTPGEMMAISWMIKE